MRRKAVNFRKMAGVHFKETKLKSWIMMCGLFKIYKMKLSLVDPYLEKSAAYGMIVYL